MTPGAKRRDALEQLVELADGLRGQGFVWGVTDCGALMLRALAVVDELGERHLERLTWSTAWGAVKTLQEVTPDAWLASIGAHPVELVDAAPGDVIVGYLEAPADGELEGLAKIPAVHILVGSVVMSSSQAHGVVFLPREATIDAALAVGATCWRLS